MITKTLYYSNYLKFYNDIPLPARVVVENSMNELYYNCFGFEWNPENPKGFVVDISYEEDIPETIQINGYLSIIPSPYNPQIIEIYNVCVHPDKRRSGVLGRLFDILDPSLYYILGVFFNNKNAYYAYTKYFFCDFFAIGKLHPEYDVTFILGGRKTSICSEIVRNNIRLIFDNVASIIPSINIEHFYNSVSNNMKEYKFLSLTYKELNKILSTDPNNEFINISTKLRNILSDIECVKVLQYPELLNLIIKFKEEFY